ncbi:class I SAM-dependent methyltransferase [Salipaludibacillus agaradhaerens]|uniref:Class I SAM-dependent methyltransferase n=1 Tax=Salipaludibacillus agaradhaerens TaxID=76935 RepID=A0A9Q4AZE8_SALAG|nr:class I SAM-dependent methyltransferase [Salipaludibacillus agaradhaerens]MCR6095232.1 class I SAM-dependent methyltransferase [Salipaludibacillus agaradhaerens]MCR6115210.1 class I SAM-dependent methyltransferase [Salipaludibacillus agaradhaerens]
MLGYYNKLSSEVYDMDKYIGRSFGDVEFYSDRLASCKGDILEPGVGTGRILIPLLERGLKVDGFDVSQEMLKICRNNCEKRGLNPKLFEGHMASFSIDTKYEAIVVPTGTFLLLHKREDSIKALKNFYNHLTNGGRIIMDISLQTDLSIDKVSTRTWESRNGDIITLETKVVEVDYINQYTISHNRYEKWANSELIQTELERFPLRWFGIEEFKMLLENMGFDDIVISADYKYGQYPTDSSEMITFEATVNKE